MTKMQLLAIILLNYFFILGHTVTPNVIVALDGSGNYKTLFEAINSAPNNSRNQYTILIKAGLYKENIVIGAEKTNLVLLGEGMDRTIISGSRSISKDLDDTATVAIHANGVVAKELTIENIAGPDKHQAVALSCAADFLAFYRCRFRGYQDTLYTSLGLQFFRECEILGTIDFICGDASVIFQNCVIYVRAPLSGQYNVITAQKRIKPTKNTGIIIQNSTITATKDWRRKNPRPKTYFGRPWRKFARTVILQSWIDNIIEPEGWIVWEGHGVEPVYYAEYRNRGPGANTARRVPWSRVIVHPSEAQMFTVARFIKGDKWIPRSIPFFPNLLP